MSEYYIVDSSQLSGYSNTEQLVVELFVKKYLVLVLKQNLLSFDTIA